MKPRSDEPMQPSDFHERDRLEGNSAISPAADCDMEKARRLVAWLRALADICEGVSIDSTNAREAADVVQAQAEAAHGNAQSWKERVEAAAARAKELEAALLKHASIGKIVGFGSQAYECRFCGHVTETWQGPLQHTSDCVLALKGDKTEPGVGREDGDGNT